MDDDVDMYGGSEVEASRASPANGGQHQDEQLALDVQQASAPTESSTLADSNAVESNTSSDLVQGSSTDEDIQRIIPGMPSSSNIECTCPADTVRFEADLELTSLNGTPIWVHKPCTQPSTTTTRPFQNPSKSSGTDEVPKRRDPEQLAAKLLGPEATAEQRLKIKNFTSKFHCDGPCKGSTKIDDYILCKKCYAWQHKECMLYGEEYDDGGPFCNRCFMIQLARCGSTTHWQREQLVKVVQKAWKFFKDPANRHKVQQRAQARKLLGAFFIKNQASFFKFVAAKKKAERLAAGPQLSNQDGDTEMDGDHERHRTPLRQSMSMTQSSPSAASGDGLDDLEELDRRLSTGEEVGALNESNSSARVPPSHKSHARKKPPSDTKAQIRAALFARTPRLKPAAPHIRSAASQQDLRAPVLGRMKPAPPRLKLVPSQQVADATTRKRPLPPDEEDVASPADSEIYQSSAPRKSAPGFVPREPTRPTKLSKQVTFNEHDLDTALAPPAKLLPKTAPRPTPTIACKCVLGLKPFKAQFFKCIECGISQHLGCHDDIIGPRPTHCNSCLASNATTKRAIDAEVANSIPADASHAEREAAIKKAKAKRSVETNGEAEYTDQFREAVKDESLRLCSTVLWKQWWNIPHPGQVNKIPGLMPAQPPEEWLEEARSRFEALLHAAGRETVVKYLQHVTEDWPPNHREVMAALSDLVLELLHRDAYRGRRQELGLIAEVCGIEGKGTMWKGSAA